MEKTKINIVSSISKRTGSSEVETNKIITEFARVMKEAANNELITVVPGIGHFSIVTNSPIRQKGTIRTHKIPDANSWYIADMENIKPVSAPIRQSAVFQYRNSTRHHIIDELKSNKKSNEIIERFIKISSMPNKLLAEQIFEISPKTLYLYRHSEKDLPTRMNEQILKLEELYTKGIELFGSSYEFNKWLKFESYGLGNTKPINLITSITGIDLVYEELVRIEFGATA
jgi:putative toxin-antitoxin system antitoxin component (TIGR02293 family)